LLSLTAGYVLYAGAAPGELISQLNIRIPSGTPPGNQALQIQIAGVGSHELRELAAAGVLFGKRLYCCTREVVSQGGAKAINPRGMGFVFRAMAAGRQPDPLDQPRRGSSFANYERRYPLVMSTAVDKFDEGLRTLNLGSRYRGDASGPFGSLFATVKPVASEMRDQLVREVGASKRIPESIAVAARITTDNAEDFKLGGRGHTTPRKRQGRRPRPVSLKVDWAKPGRFGGTIALCVLNGTDLFCADYGVDACSNTSSHFGHVTARASRLQLS
jgi:hypothetical protein